MRFLLPFFLFYVDVFIISKFKKRIYILLFLFLFHLNHCIIHIKLIFDFLRNLCLSFPKFFYGCSCSLRRTVLRTETKLKTLIFRN